MRFVPLFACLLTLAACGGSAANTLPAATHGTVAIQTASATATATVTQTPEPTPEATPSPSPVIDLSSSHPRQGGFLIVRLVNPPPGLNGASASFNGGSYTMLAVGEHWFAVAGLAMDIAVGDYPIEVTAASGTLASATVSIADGGFQYESIELPPSSIDLLSDQAAVARERQTLAQIYGAFTPQRLWSGAWILPAQGAITNPFGLQRSINGGSYFGHTGTDIANAKGTPVTAAASGTVVLAGPLYLYGNAVVIDHGAGVFTSYNHLDSIAITVGQSVTIGDLVGFMGETGFVSGPHVHWEAIIGGVRTDPMLWTQVAVDP